MTKPFIKTVKCSAKCSALIAMLLAWSSSFGALAAIETEPLSSDAGEIWQDRDVVTLGNPDGDVTIVEYGDYQCPACKTADPALERAVRDDGNVRFVFKDWPVIGPMSVFAAKMALAARFQGKYVEAHKALIQAKRFKTEDDVRSALAKSGIDAARCEADLKSHQEEIRAILDRSSQQTEELDFDAPPAFIVGRRRLRGPFDLDGFKQAIAAARQAAEHQGE